VRGLPFFIIFLFHQTYKNVKEYQGTQFER
jgi:hypothetical protein